MVRLQHSAKSYPVSLSLTADGTPSHKKSCRRRCWPSPTSSGTRSAPKGAPDLDGQVPSVDRHLDSGNGAAFPTQRGC